MDSEKITQDLNRRFAAPLPEFYKRRIIVWHDEDREFEDGLSEIALTDAKIVVLTGTNYFSTKKLLGVDDTSSNYLVYCPISYESHEENWLLDIELYSEEFRADLVSMWMDEMGIPQTPGLRKGFKSYRKFLNAKERRRWITMQTSIPTIPAHLQMAVMAALAGLKEAKLNHTIKAVLKGGLSAESNSVYRDFVNYEIDEALGNINQSVDVLLKTSSLFDPFPPEMGTDTAFLDRMHCFIPRWEIPKFRPEHFTDDYGFITDYLAEFIRELRKEQYGDALDKYYHLNQRDTIAVRKMVGGFLKLLYPDGEFTKEQLEEVLRLALEMRRRVKEQLKKLGGMEFYDVNFSYIDNETFEEQYVSVPEQGGGKLIPEGMCNPGQVYTVGQGKSGMIGVFRLESQMLPGNGKFERTGIGSDRNAGESSNTAFNFLKANGNRISGTISTTTKDYIINYQDLQGIGMTGKLALPTLIALCSIAIGKPVLSSTAVMGEISISGTMIKVDELANSLQICLDSGAKKVLLPITSAVDISTVPQN